MPVTPPLLNVPGRHGPFIQRQLPDWLKHATPQDLLTLGDLLVAQPVRKNGVVPWHGAATAEERALLSECQRRVRRSGDELASLLRGLKGIAEFCEPLLIAQLKQTLGISPDVHACEVVEIHQESVLLGAMVKRVPLQQSLMQAALQNFPREASFEPGSALAPRDAFGLELIPGTESGYPRFRYRYTDKLDIEPARFARLCHELDLGGQYQQHLRAIFAAPATQGMVRSRYIRAFKDQLLLCVQTAFMKQEISQQARQMLTSLVQGEPQPLLYGQPVRVSQLSLFGAPLYDVLIISANRDNAREIVPVLLYLPGAPLYPLKEYPSARAALRDLCTHLTLPPYQRLLRRYLAHEDQARVLNAIDEALHHLVPVPGSALHQRVVNPKGRVRATETFITDELFGYLYERHLDKTYATARALAVPSAVVDETARKARLAYWESIGLNALNAAAFFVPALGAVMAAVTAVQLVGEVIDGVQAWEDGDRALAWAHLESVGLNVAFMLGMAVVGRTAVAMAPSELMDGLIQVRLPNGQARLWQPAWDGYVSTIELQGVEADGEGVVHHDGRTFIRVEGRVHEIARNAEGDWCVRHDDAHAYQPLLAHNGQGAWRLVGEQVTGWSRGQLLRRIGHLAEGLSDAQLEQALQISGLEESAVRRMHMDRQPLPPLLHDTLRLLQGERWPATQVEVPGDVQRLRRMFPSLTDQAAQEMLARVPGSAREELAQGLAGPSLQLAEEARIYQRQLRVSRAIAGLYAPNLASLDSERLAAGLLAHLPGWSGEMCIELRDGSLEGSLLQRVGDPGAPLKVLVRNDERYAVFDENAEPLAREESIASALLKALPDSEREALQLMNDAPQALLEALYRQALADRGQTFSALGLQPIRPWFRSPMRLADGRRGYTLGGTISRLSPHSRRLRELFPEINAAEVQLTRTRLIARYGSLEVGLSSLEAELARLEHALAQWYEEGDAYFERGSRQIFGERLIGAWRLTGGDGWQTLDVSGLRVDALPVLSVHMEHIHELHMSHMQLNAIPDGFLSGFTHLRNLDLEGNALDVIPAAVASMPQLQLLNMEGNHLSVSTTMFDALRPLRHLHALSLRGNGMTEFPAEAMQVLTALPQLRTLSLRFNRLVFDNVALERLSRLPLEFLDLSSNRLVLDEQGAQLFSRFVRLRQLNLSGNALGHAPQVGNLARLETLHLQQCGLEQWPDGLTTLMEQRPLQLRTVDVSRNQITSLPDFASTQFGARLRVDGHLLRGLYANYNPLDVQAVQRLRAVGVHFVSEELEARAFVWLEDASGVQRNLWNSLFQDASASALLDVVERLQLSSEFQRDFASVRTRVWNMLALASEHTVLREELQEIARAFPPTCGDAGTDAFSELEVAVLRFECRQRAINAQAQSAELLGLYKQLFRRAQVQQMADHIALRRKLRRAALRSDQPLPELDPLDDLSDATLARHGVDDIEIRLSIRQRLAGRLDYPEPSSSMLYADLAEVSDATLERLVNAVREGDTYAARRAWMVEDSGWQHYLKSIKAAQFEVLSEFWNQGLEYLDYCIGSSSTAVVRLDPSVLELLAAHLQQPLLDEAGKLRKVELSEQQFVDGCSAIAAAHQQAETGLIMSLTHALMLEN